MEAYLHDSVDSWVDVGVLVVLQLLNVLVGFVEELKAGAYTRPCFSST